MKLFVVLAAVALAHAAKLDNTYLPPSHSQSSGGSGNFLQAPFGADQGHANGFGRSGNGFGQNGNGFGQNGNGFGQNGNGFAQNEEPLNGNDYQNANSNFGNFEARPERPQAAFERTASILRQDTQNDGETYSYAFETENGIYAEENGVATNGVEAQGGYSYTGDDGQVYSIRYTADQNGFVPQGDHLPTPPPVPEEILKALEQNARDEAAGIYDDGSYSEGKYSNDEQQYNNNNNNEYSNNNGNAYQNQYEGDEDSVVTTNALFRNNQGSFNNGAGATSQAYLPPFAQRNGNEGSFNGNANQGSANSGAARTNQAYLPPFAQRNGNQGFNSNQRSTNGVPRPSGNQGTFNSNQGVARTNQAYLPPFAQGNDESLNGNQGLNTEATSQSYLPPAQRSSSNRGSFRPLNQGVSDQGFNGASRGASKAYLPPREGQRSNAFGRRQPSFSARNGYNY